MTIGVGYTRYSTEYQTHESTQAQIREIKEYAKRNNIDLIKIYSDEEISGSTDKKPAFKQMINDAKQGKFETLVVYSVNRFARNKYDSAIYKRELSLAGVKIHYTSQPISDDPTGRFLEGMLEATAQFYNEQTGQTILRNLKLLASKAQFTGGYVPLGYKIENKHYVIDPYESEAIKLTFKMYTEFYTYREIIEELNDKGYKTRNNSDFKNNSLNSILKNEKYIGRYIYNKRAPRVYGKRSNTSYKDAENMIIIDNAIPSIIDDETWNKAQERLKQRKKKNTSGQIYILSGLLYCAKCKDKMYGDTRTKSGTYHYYRCKNAATA